MAKHSNGDDLQPRSTKPPADTSIFFAANNHNALLPVKGTGFQVKARCANGRISFMFKDGPTQALAFGGTACVLMCTDVLAKGAGAEISTARTTAANGWRRGDPHHVASLDACKAQEG